VAEVNELILQKLRKYPPAVAQVALEAVRLAGFLPQRAVEESLRDVVRQAVRQKGGKA